MVTAWGVDYAFPPIPRPSVLAAAANPDGTVGKNFAVRYGGKGTTDKMLTASELSGLRAHGIDVVANTEGSAGGFRGYAAGQDWARAGRDWFDNLGRPAGRPIYFSADWDVQESDWPDLKAALDGAASIIGRSCVGLYGGLYAIQQAQRTGAATWFWQTYAWSTRNGNIVWAPGTHMQQYRNQVTIDAADCDLNRALTADYGQWGYSDMDLNSSTGSDVVASRDVENFFGDFWDIRDPLVGYAPGVAHAKVDPNSPFGQLLAAFKPGQLAAVPAAVTKVAADVAATKAAAAQQAADIAAIKQAVQAGVSVDPNVLAAAIETAIAKAVADIASKINPAA